MLWRCQEKTIIGFQSGLKQAMGLSAQRLTGQTRGLRISGDRIIRRDGMVLNVALGHPMEYCSGHLRSRALEPEQDKQETTEEVRPQPRLLRWLFDNRISMRLYVLRAGLISLLPSLVLVSVLATTGLITQETTPSFEGSAVGLFVMIVIIGPPIETLLMALVLRILSFITKRRIPLAVMSACLWACLHSIAAPAWGLGVIWPFFVFSCSYLTWRERAWWRAILVTSCVHAFQNVVPSLAAIANQ